MIRNLFLLPLLFLFFIPKSFGLTQDYKIIKNFGEWSVIKLLNETTKNNSHLYHAVTTASASKVNQGDVVNVILTVSYVDKEAFSISATSNTVLDKRSKTILTVNNRSHILKSQGRHIISYNDTQDTVIINDCIIADAKLKLETKTADQRVAVSFYEHSGLIDALKYIIEISQIS